MKGCQTPQTIAANVITNVLNEKKSLTSILSRIKSKNSNIKNYNLIQELCYGTLRWFPRLEAIANYFIHKPLKAKDYEVFVLILIGIYQMDFLRIPDHAAVFQTVEAAQALGKPWAAKFINAILRNYLRNKPAVTNKIEAIPSAHYAHPKWLLAAIQKNWPEHWQNIIEQNNQRPPMSLRINKRKLSREDYLHKLQQEGISAAVSPYTSQAIILHSACDVSSLPGYAEGEISVQDVAAGLAAELLLPCPGQRVLDACAAPGGKTTHLLEFEPQLKEVLAIDDKASRLIKIEENLTRLGLAERAHCILADAGQVDKWWDGQTFDRILLDVPCSATGVIRRHPDVKILRCAADIKALAAQQLKLLNALWPLLKSAGILLYVSCSIFPQENSEVLTKFLENCNDAHDDPIDFPYGIAMQVGRQILPSAAMDGFFYARLKKA